MRAQNRDFIRYYHGPENPKTDLQWLQKNQALLRNMSRLVRSPKLMAAVRLHLAKWPIDRDDPEQMARVIAELSMKMAARRRRAEEKTQ